MLGKNVSSLGVIIVQIVQSVTTIRVCLKSLSVFTIGHIVSEFWMVRTKMPFIALLVLKASITSVELENHIGAHHVFR